jgi:CheY-like chemotaxis protein
MLRLLDGAGFEVHVQATAVGALANIKRLGIEVAIVDVHLPQIMGDQFVALLRKNKTLDQVRVVLITGEEDEAVLARLGSQAKANAILSKAKLATDLVPLIRRLATRGATADDKRRLKILLVEDDKAIASSTASWLTSMGHEVNRHDRPFGLLSAVAAQRPDVLLLDANSAATSQELVSVLKNNKKLAALKVVLYFDQPAETLAGIMTRTMAHGAIRKDGNARSFAQQFNALLREGG